MSFLLALSLPYSSSSQHDLEDPPPDGAYIMYAFATSGQQPNNDRFSIESRNLMDVVIAREGQGTGGCACAIYKEFQILFSFCKIYAAWI